MHLPSALYLSGDICIYEDWIHWSLKTSLIHFQVKNQNQGWNWNPTVQRIASVTHVTKIAHSTSEGSYWSAPSIMGKVCLSSSVLWMIQKLMAEILSFIFNCSKNLSDILNWIPALGLNFVGEKAKIVKGIIYIQRHGASLMLNQKIAILNQKIYARSWESICLLKFSQKFKSIFFDQKRSLFSV